MQPSRLNNKFSINQSIYNKKLHFGLSLNPDAMELAKASPMMLGRYDHSFLSATRHKFSEHFG
jgi:hypothetical protein